MNARAGHWWSEAIVYQVYVRSFADSDGDGNGDLRGIIDHLDHLVALGVDAIWLNPCYPSPQRDHGYDVADYFDIQPEYGTLAIFDELVACAADRGIRVVMDIVPNHCSDEHPWFRAALQAPPGSRERARFYFRDGREDGSTPPNNWRAAFGGPAWTRANDDPGDGQWYLGTFTPQQPDFDHTDSDVQELFADVLTFWFDRGVEGFRVDAIATVGKDPLLPDQPPVDADVDEVEITWLNPYVVFRHEGNDVWRRWRATVDEYERDHPGRDLFLLAEAYAVGRPDIVRRFTQPDQFHQMFAFDLTLSPWHPATIAQALRDPLMSAASTGAPPVWTLSNHDVQRTVTRLGRADAHLPERWTNSNFVSTDAPVDVELGLRRARAMAALAFALPGSLYLYQGEELGLPEVLDLPDDRREDPVFELTGGRQVGRDGCRVPIPWTDDADTAHGFSDRPVDPWLPQPAGWGEWSVATQAEDPTSMLCYYAELAIARRDHALPNGSFADVLDVDSRLVVVRRGELVVIVNPTAEPVVIDPDSFGLGGLSPLLASLPSEMHTPGVLPADSAVWLVP